MGKILHDERGDDCRFCIDRDGKRRPRRVVQAAFMLRQNSDRSLFAPELTMFFFCEVCDSPVSGARPNWAFRSQQQ